MKNTVDVLRSVKPHTRRAYEQAWRDLIKFLGDERRLMSLTTADVQDWVNDMLARGLAASTIRTRLSAVSALFDVHDDPAQGIKRPEPEAIPETASLDSAEQVAKLLRAIDLDDAHGAQDFALISILLLTGWGVERVRTLTWTDFIMRGGVVLLRDNQENIQLPRSLWEVIVGMVRKLHGTISLPTGAFLFVALRGFGGTPVSTQPSVRKPLSPQEVNRRIARYARLAGLNGANLSTRGLAVTKKNLGNAAIYSIIEKIKPISPSLVTPGRNLRVWRNIAAR